MVLDLASYDWLTNIHKISKSDKKAVYLLICNIILNLYLESSKNQTLTYYVKVVLNICSSTSSPIKTEFGYHIIMLKDIRNSKPKKFKDIKQKIIDKIKQRSLSKLEKEIRNNEKITILDFKTVVKEINN